LILLLSPAIVPAQLQPGFNGHEYLGLLRLGADHSYRLVYRSPESGLFNRWDMWYRDDDSVAVISIRGTVQDKASWLENFYAAMVPATGSLQISDSSRFDYQLAADPKATVHVGWLLGLGFLAPTMVDQVREADRRGIHAILIFGHSQGGALAYLTRSYLYYLQQKGGLDGQLRFKTYCSAAPKPGNLFYAYDYDFITRDGWSFNVVNAADWVPETPFSIQALEDMNRVNPFTNINNAFNKQPWAIRWYIKGKFNKLSKTTRSAQEEYTATLGQMVYKQVKKLLPGFREPVYSESFNYQRAGTPVVLQPDSVYYSRFPNDSSRIFTHHSYDAYRMLATKYYGN
jgi:hypothetical protein